MKPNTADDHREYMRNGAAWQPRTCRSCRLLTLQLARERSGAQRSLGAPLLAVELDLGTRAPSNTTGRLSRWEAMAAERADKDVRRRLRQARDRLAAEQEDAEASEQDWRDAMDCVFDATSGPVKDSAAMAEMLEDAAREEVLENAA